MGDGARETLDELGEILEPSCFEPPAGARALGAERACRGERSAAEPGEIEPVDRHSGPDPCKLEDERGPFDAGLADVGDAEGPASSVSATS